MEIFESLDLASNVTEDEPFQPSSELRALLVRCLAQRIEASGDASFIAAQDTPNGTPLYFDISQFPNPAHPIASPCNIRIRGVAPGASLAGLDAFSSLGNSTASTLVQAIEWAVYDDDVHVINESFGDNPYFDSGTDPISLANSLAVSAGVRVVVSSGDAGTAGTIDSPATDRDVTQRGQHRVSHLRPDIGWGDPVRERL